MTLLDIAEHLAFWTSIIFFFIGISSSIFIITIFIDMKPCRQSVACYSITSQSISDISTLLILSCKLTYYFEQSVILCAIAFSYLIDEHVHLK